LKRLSLGSLPAVARAEGECVGGSPARGALFFNAKHSSSVGPSSADKCRPSLLTRLSLGSLPAVARAVGECVGGSPARRAIALLLLQSDKLLSSREVLEV